MRPLKLRISGLRSWRREQELAFRDVDLAAVVGPTGAGKSSILEAIIYALYNATTYDAREVRTLISSDESTVSVAFDFEADGEEWRATRSTSRGSYPPSVHKLTCLTDPESHPIVEGRTPVNGAVVRLLGLEYDQFISAVLLPQGRFQRLLTATEGERTGILKGVFRLDELASTRDRADDLRRSTVDPALDSAHDERSKLLPDPEAERETAQALAAEAKEVVAMLEGCAKRSEEHREQARQLGEAAAAAERAAQKLDEGRGSVPSLEDVIAAAAELAGRAESLVLAREEATEERDRARAAVRDAEGRGRSVAELSAACQFLASAAEALPRHDVRARKLVEERKRIAAGEAELVGAREQLEADRGKLQGLRNGLKGVNDDHEEARRSLRAARELLSSARTTAGSDECGVQAVVDAEGKLVAAQLAADGAATAAERAQAEFGAAEQALEALRRGHDAAHLAAGLVPGDECPVCHGAVPTDFAPDEPPSEMAGAEATVQTRREAAETALSDAVAATTTAAGLRASVGDRKLEHSQASEAAAVALAAVRGAGIEGELSVNDDELLAPHVAAETAAEGAARTAADTVAALAAAAGKTEEELVRRSNELESMRRSLESQASALELERAALRTRVQQLPAALRPSSITEHNLLQVQVSAARALEEVQQLARDERQGTELRDKLVRELELIAEERTRRVDAPRRDALRHGDQLVLELRLLEDRPPLPNRPGDANALAEQAEWLTIVCSAAEATATALRAEVTRGSSLRQGAESAAMAALAAAGEALGEELESPEALRHQLDDHRARRREAVRRLERANDELPKVKALAQRIEALRGRRAALDEVCRLLNDGQFIGWLVARRQRHLLAVASEILAGMTDERYRFAADFTVVDGRSGQPRSAKTLSGGESFLASLALALGMAELAARNGGRIGSLYLDEGFGSLDPNALDEAIEALEARARAGQMIMVISHVPAVAQRIERVLQVKPSPSGSTAEWLDDADRDALLIAAATAG